MSIYVEIREAEKSFYCRDGKLPSKLFISNNKYRQFLCENQSIVNARSYEDADKNEVYICNYPIRRIIEDGELFFL